MRILEDCPTVGRKSFALQEVPDKQQAAAHFSCVIAFKAVCNSSSRPAIFASGTCLRASNARQQIRDTRRIVRLLPILDQMKVVRYDETSV